MQTYLTKSKLNPLCSSFIFTVLIAFLLSAQLGFAQESGTAVDEDTQSNSAEQKQLKSLLILNSKSSSDLKTAKKQLSRIFSGRQRSWSRNVGVQLILLPEGSPEMKWLCNQVLDMPESLLRRFIYQRVYRGIMKPPIEVENSEEALKVLRAQPGAIAPIILPETQLESSTLKDSQLLLIEM